MNRIIRNLALAAAFFCCLGGLQAQVTTIDSGYCGGEGDSTNLTWTLTSDSVLTIYGSGKMADYIAYPRSYPWKDHLWQIKTVIIGDSVTTIGNAAFYSSWVNSVTFGKNVKNIGKGAFYQCGITSVTIPNSVEAIGSSAFENCRYLVSLTIGDNVILIESEAFSKSGLVSVTIGDGVSIIENQVFYHCSLLDSVTIGNNVTQIRNQAFTRCNLSSVLTIPDKVMYIGTSAFEESGLTTVSMGKGLSVISREAFNGCTHLASITVHPETPPVTGYDVFGNVDSTIPVYVQCESTPKYKSDAGWSYFSNFYAIDPPPTPTPTVTQQNNTMLISWTSTGAPDYEIYRNNVRLTKTSTTSYTDNNLKSGTTYCYQIKAIEENCESLLSDTVCRTFDIDDTGIKQLRITNYELRVYPNPTNYELRITNYEFKEGDVIEIYNVVGQKVLSYKSLQSQETTINIEPLPNGIYYLKIGNKVAKFVKY